MQEEQILEQIFDNGFATTIIELANGKIKIKIKNLTAEDLFNIDAELKTASGSQLHLMQLYGVRKLANITLQYNNTKFETSEKAFEFLKKLPTAVINKLLKEQGAFESEVSKALTGEAIENAFFGQSDSQPKVGQSQEGSIQEPQVP